MGGKLHTWTYALDPSTPVGAIVHGCVCFLGTQKQTGVSRGAEGALIWESHSKKELDAIITIYIRPDGCFYS